MTQPKPCPVCGRDVPASDGYVQVVCDCCIRVDEELITLRNYQEHHMTKPRSHINEGFVYLKPCPICGREATTIENVDRVYCRYCDCSLVASEEPGSRSITLWNSLDRPTTPPTVSTRIQVQVASQTLSLTQDEAQALWDALTPHVRHPDIAEQWKTMRDIP